MSKPKKTKHYLTVAEKKAMVREVKAAGATREAIFAAAEKYDVHPTTVRAALRAGTGITRTRATKAGESDRLIHLGQLVQHADSVARDLGYTVTLSKAGA